MGCSAMVFGNWDGVPAALLSSTYSQGCSGCLYRGTLLLLVPVTSLHLSQASALEYEVSKAPLLLESTGSHV